MTDDELISLSDFKSIRLAISVSNTTSRTKVGADAGIQLVEFTAHGFALEVPKTMGAIGHSLIVEFTRADNPEIAMVSVTGKVEKLKKTTPARPKDAAKDSEEEAELYRAEISLVQFDEAEWQGFKDQFSNRQAEIEKFLAAARGY